MFTYRLLGFFFLLALALININVKHLVHILKTRQEHPWKKIPIGFLLLLISLILLFHSGFGELWIVQLVIYLIGLDLILQGIGNHRPEFFLLSLTVFTYALIFIIAQNVSVVYLLFQYFSLLVSGGVGQLAQPVSLGASASGLWMFLSFVIYVKLTFFLSGKMRQRRYIYYSVGSIIGLLVGWIVFILVHSLYSFESIYERSNAVFLLFIFQSVVLVLFTVKSVHPSIAYDTFWVDHVKPVRFLKGKVVVVILLLFFSGLLMTTFLPGGNIEESRTVGIYQPGIGVGGLDLPQYGRYGRQAAGFFGILPQYLEAYDFSVSVFGENITEEILDGLDVLVIINLGETFSDEELDFIWGFVDRGGALLVMGDHTDIGGIMGPLNTLLEQVGIEFLFDSAIPIKDHWKSCYYLLHHPVSEGLTASHDIDVSVGASLALNPTSSFPIIMGKGGFSDIGNYLDVDRSYLGDYDLNPGEQLSDVVLVAGAYYGDGRVVVFGDTSPFQNLALSTSHRLISNVFSWLTSTDTGGASGVRLGGGVVLLVGVVVLLYHLPKKFFVFLPVVLCSALILSSIVNGMVCGEREISGAIAFVDVSHGERINRDYYKDESVTGLMLNLMRNEYQDGQRYLPLIMDEFSTKKLREGKILVLIAPTRLFSADEVEEIEHFVSEGGLLIMSMGYNDKEASSLLLETFGFDILPEPYGPVPYVDENPEASQNEPRFVDSWPIYVREFDNATHVFYSIEFGEEINYLVVFKEYEEGGVLLIGDSQFLLDDNLESLYDNWPGNIDFIRNIMSELKSLEVPQ